MGRRDRILSALSVHEWKLGIDISREAQVSLGTLYVTLYHLEEESLVESRIHEGMRKISEEIKRREYRLTKGGLRRKIEIEQNESEGAPGALAPKPT